MFVAEIREDVKYTVRSEDQNERVPVQISSGCHVKDRSPVKPCPSMINILGGTTKRMCVKLPISTRLKRPELVACTLRVMMRMGLTPFSPYLDTSQETWLANTPYPEWRKTELRECWADCGGVLSRWHFEVSSFMKDETYADWKHARAINARSDQFKCAVGPIIKRIEEVLYEQKEFIKHVPVVDRPSYIEGMLNIPGTVCVATDYTSFESHFSKAMMEDIEFILYEFMTQHLPEHKQFMGYFRNVVAGRNKCKFKRFNVELDATRMSGEMCTSLGNGFANLVMMTYACEVKGSQVHGVVEGDDGLFVVKGALPTREDFASLGMNIKLDVHPRYNEASFCGMIFDPTDKINLSDPSNIVLNFGWSGRRYVNAKQARLLELLRAKSLSFAHMYQGSPIVQSLAHYGLRMTKHINLESLLERRGMYANEWVRKRLIDAMEAEPEKIAMIEVPKNTRLLCESKFGISIPSQLAIEEYLNSKTDLSPLDHPEIDALMTATSAAYDCHYTGTRESDRLDSSFIPYRQELAVLGEQLDFTQQARTNGVERLVSGLEER